MITANIFFKTSWEAYRLMVIVPLLARYRLPDVELFVESEPLKAYVNHGKWLVKCECGGAEKMWEEGVFFCQSCLNARHKHQYRHAIFPSNREKIEQLLEIRPVPNRNWNNQRDIKRLGREETVADLKAENELHKAELLEVS